MNSWDLMEFHGIYWDFMVCNGISWDFIGFSADSMAVLCDLIGFI